MLFGLVCAREELSSCVKYHSDQNSSIPQLPELCQCLCALFCFGLVLIFVFVLLFLFVYFYFCLDLFCFVLCEGRAFHRP